MPLYALNRFVPVLLTEFGGLQKSGTLSMFFGKNFESGL
jgi:hypothetical protein